MNPGVARNTEQVLMVCRCIRELLFQYIEEEKLPIAILISRAGEEWAPRIWTYVLMDVKPRQWEELLPTFITFSPSGPVKLGGDGLDTALFICCKAEGHDSHEKRRSDTFSSLFCLHRGDRGWMRQISKAWPFKPVTHQASMWCSNDTWLSMSLVWTIFDSGHYTLRTHLHYFLFISICPEKALDAAQWDLVRLSLYSSRGMAPFFEHTPLVPPGLPDFWKKLRHKLQHYAH